MPFLRQVARLLSATLALGLAAPAVGLLLSPVTLRADEAEPLTLTISEAVLSRDYDGQARPLDPAADLSISPGTVDDYTFKITYAGKTAAPKNAGSYALKVVATTKTRPARTATATATLLIRKIPLLVYANDQVRLFGVANPPLTISYDGFVNGESVSALARRPAAKTTAKPASPADYYDITVSGGSAKNYELFGYNTGRLTVLPAFPGTYESFLTELGALHPVGKLILTLPARGAAFTGRLELASEGAALPLSGKLSPEPDLGGASGSAARKVSSGDTYRVDFVVSDGGLVAEIFLREKGTNDDISVFTLSTPTLLADFTGVTPPLAGAYTVALLDPTSDDPIALSPAGSGFATATLSANGTLKLAGKFADGANLTASVRPDANRLYRLFLRPYGSRKNSYAAGGFVLQPHLDPDRMDRYYVPTSALHTLHWQKAPRPSGRDALFPDGFGPISSLIALDPWLAPVKAKAATRKAEAVDAITLPQRLGLVANSIDPGFAEITYGTFENLGFSSVELPYDVEFTPANKAVPVLDTPPANPRAWKITSLKVANGRFTGTFKLTDTDYVTWKVYNRSVTFQGILRQPPVGDSTVGAGYFILKDLPFDFMPETRSVDLRFLRNDG